MKSEQELLAYIVPHSHWDREWYMPFEKHRVYLVELIDNLIEIAESDAEYKGFHLDGQTIVLDDYLEIKPEKRELVKKLIKEGKLQVGPWYILQDEFLTSSEANARNLLVGYQDAREYGRLTKIGYFPDSFGNIGQAPQLLKQAGMTTALFGRGVKAVGFNNEAFGSYESAYSEMRWRSPDGSEVLGLLFANWYNNGVEIPAEPEQAKAYWKQKISEAKRFASTKHLLFLNGCDHQPVQMDLTESIKVANEVMPEVSFSHSSFEEYIQALETSLPSNLATIEGELRSQRTNGWFTLVNTASARVYLKQANQRTQTMLEKVAEPLAAFAYKHGNKYPHHLLTYAWKTLMQNHPHDSICGCSVDEVHREMMTRFDKSYQVASEIVNSSISYLTGLIDTASLTQQHPDAIPFAVFNTTGWERSGVAIVKVDVERIKLHYGKQAQIVADLKQIDLTNMVVKDVNGNAVGAKIRDLGVTFGYTLPKDAFRQPYMARTVEIELLASKVPALGYSSYLLVTGSEDFAGEENITQPIANTMENEFLYFKILDNGSLWMLDKRNNRIYEDLNVFENVGDIGNEYIFRQPDGDVAFTTRNLKADVRLVEHSNEQTVYEVVHRWFIPASADEKLEEEIQEFVSFLERKASRSSQFVDIVLTTRYTLVKGNAALKVQTSFNNVAKDHRIRVLFPTDTTTTIHRADSVFEVAIRDSVPAPEWENPSNCQHQQAFVNVSDDQGGLTVANLGLNEYEVLRDGRNTIAVTLLRAVRELGDWGVFPTPEAQCLGEHVFEYFLIPHTDAASMTDTFCTAYQEQVPWTTAQLSFQNGELPLKHSFFNWEGQHLALSAVKVNNMTGDYIYRWFNLTGEASKLNLSEAPGTVLYRSNIVEEQKETMESQETIVRPYEIITIGKKQ